MSEPFDFDAWLAESQKGRPQFIPIPPPPVYFLPEGEDLHSAAMRAYYNDPIFSARCKMVMRHLSTAEARLDHDEDRTILYALYLDDLIREKAGLRPKECNPAMDQHAMPHNGGGCILR